MKKFFEEFKAFITRGNVVDMAVGVIVGSAFTAIVNGLSNYVLKPIVNALLALLLGKDSLTGIYTMLLEVKDDAGAIDFTQSIYIDWGAFINAVINFFLIAFVLFTIMKIYNRFLESREKWIVMLEKGKLTKEDKLELRSRGVKLSDRDGVCAYLEEKRARLAEEEKKKKAEEEEKARKEREENPTAEDLLKLILAEIRSGKTEG